LAKLADAERNECPSFWMDIETLLEPVQGQAPERSADDRSLEIAVAFVAHTDSWRLDSGPRRLADKTPIAMPEGGKGKTA
jgi:hypothetical protein